MKLYKKPTSTNWYVRFQLAGQEYKTSCFTSVRREAEEYARHWRTRIEQEAAAPLVPTLAVLREKELARLADEGRNAAYVHAVRIHFDHLNAFFRDVKAITADSLEAYVKHRRAAGKKRQTVAKELTTLRRGLRLARIAGPEFWPKLSRDPPDAKRASKRHDHAEWHEWLKRLHGEAHDLAMFALLTGLRKAELYRATRQDIREIEDYVVLTVREKVKRPHPRQVVLGTRAQAIAERLPFRQAHVTAFRHACAGNPTGNITLRDCRAAFATAGDRAGDSRATDLAMGHSGIPARYQKADYARLAAVAAAVEAWLCG